MSLPIQASKHDHLDCDNGRPGSASSSKSVSSTSSLELVGSILSGLGASDLVSSPSVVLAARKWRRLQERAVNKRLSDLKYEKRQRDPDVEREVAELVARRVPLDLLTKEWFSQEKLTTDQRIYLVEKLIPTLVLGLEKVIIQVKNRGLVDTDQPCPTFNPINFLAQFLMRNNPKYSNLSHTSPYTKTLKKLLENLKRDIYNQDENRLAKLKAEAQQRRLERQRNERMNFLAKKGRAEALQEMFLEWAEERNAVISLSLVQSALKSFGDYVESLSVHSEKASMISLDIEETDITGRMIGMREYVEYVGKHTACLKEESFATFLRHMSNLAQEYRVSAELETVRTILTNLFIACDHGGAGLLDRQRVLRLLQTFYDNNRDSEIKDSLRNPRRWPVVEIGEEEDFDDETETDTQIFQGPLSTEDISHSSSNKELLQTPKTEGIAGAVEGHHISETIAQDEIVINPEASEPSGGETQSKIEITEVNSASEPVDEVAPTPKIADVQEESNDGENNNIESINLENEGKNEMRQADGEGERPAQRGNDNAEVLDNVTLSEEKKDADGESAGNKQMEAEEKSEQGLSSRQDLKVLAANPSISDELEQEIREIIDSRSRSGSLDSPSKSRAQSITTGSAFDPHSLNQVQFCNLIIKFLGETPKRDAVEAIVRYLRAGYRETEEEKMERLARARLEARSAKRRRQLDQLFDLWDIDGSGFLELSEVEFVLSKWREDGEDMFEKARDIFEDNLTRLSRKAFHKLVRGIVASFPDEDCFETLVAFLTTSVERSFEERKRGEFRQKLLLAIDTASQTSGALLDPVFKTAFQGLLKDAELHGRNKKISCYVAMLERNDDLRTLRRGTTFLRYVASTQDDMALLLNKVLHRDMTNVSFAAVDSGKPIHVPRVLNNGGVHLWNQARREEGIEGSFIVLPLKDHDKQVVGVLGIDTMADPHEKAIFVTHEISFFQGVAKALSAATQFVDMRRKTVKIAESAVSWILRRSPNVHEVNIYLVEPGLKVSDGLILRKMVTIGHNNHEKHFEKPPRLERKDNLFRDYLFKCIDTSETLTADAYGERHLAFPLRDADGIAVAIVDISIGGLRQLPPHESKEIHRMLKLLALAHKEVTREVAGEEKNMVLEVEKEHEEQRIDVLFDRIMLQDLRDNVGRLDARAFAEIKSYKDPPKIVHDILKAVLGIYFSSRQTNEDIEEKFEEWTSCKQLVNNDLVAWISTFDPTAGENLAVDGERLSQHLSSVPTGAVAKHGSLPAQHLFNWAFVCLSLIEHTAKMRETRVKATAVMSKQDDGDLPSESKGRTNSGTSGFSK